jgi:steroid 5-alpha reductase family enzyme
MSDYFYYPLVTLGIITAYMTVVWAIARTIRNNSIVDVAWAFNFLFTALIILALTGDTDSRSLVVYSLGSLWSLRLGIHLATRVFGHIHEEEGRYRQLREEWKNNLNLKFFVFFIMQGISNVFLAIPWFIMVLNDDPELSALEYAGAAMWLLSITGEGISDLQLAQFKKDPDNKGRVCDVGLWYYSRHPNYFFQLMIWISVLVMAVSSPYGWIAVVCPISIAYLLFKVTGIPMTEEQSLRSRPEAYRRYQETTSMFVPWFKKQTQGN